MQYTIARFEISPQLKAGLSLGLLIIANVIPALGVLLWEWDSGYLLLLYWAENLVIGFYNVLKMLATGWYGGVLISTLFTVLFFSIHYGGFVAVHGAFLIELTSFGDADSMDTIMQDLSWPMWLVFLELLWNVVSYMFSYMSVAMLIAFIALFVSHGGSFVMNFLMSGEYERTTPRQLMGAPYGRIVVMHIVVILGAFLVNAFGSPVLMLLLLVAIKIAMDIVLHNRSHGILERKKLEPVVDTN